MIEKIQTLKIYFKISIFYFLLSVYLYEFLFTFYINDHRLINIAKNYFKTSKYDMRSTFDVYDQSNKKDTYLITFPQDFVGDFDNKIFPLSGVSKSQLIDCNENGYFSIIETDRYGFNNPDEEWESKKIDYLLIGDSSTMGSCVNRPNDPGSLIRKKMRKKVLNLGFGGNGPLMNLGTLIEYLPKNTEKILWIHHPNDITDLQNELRNPILLNYLNDIQFKQDLINKQSFINVLQIAKAKKRADKYRYKKKYELKFDQFIRLQNLRNNLREITKTTVVNKTKFDENPPFNAYRKILKSADYLSKKNNSNLYFIYIPSYYHFKETTSDHNKKEMAKILSIVEELDIQFINIFEKVENSLDDPLIMFPFRNFGHYNEFGYDFISDLILENIN